MSEATLLVGDVYARLAELDDESVDLAVTSPPFWKLRSYLASDDPAKRMELGGEDSPGEYLQNQLRVVAALDHALAPHGSICWEIGDTYAGSGGAGGDYAEGGMRDGQPLFDGSGRTEQGSRTGVDKMRPGNTSRGNTKATGVPMDKSLCGIPTLFAWSLAYGRNLLTGEPSPAGRWIIRNVVIWARPNPPVGQLYDKFRPGTSYLTIATRARDRYFDLDAVRVPAKTKDDGRSMSNPKSIANPDRGDDGQYGHFNAGGVPPTDYWEPWPIESALWDWWSEEVWNISTHGYTGSHYAVFPPSLVVRPIKTMCPERVCRTCGKPSTRLVESIRKDREGNTIDTDFTQGDRSRGLRQTNEGDGGPRFSHVERRELGWSDCGHDDWRRGCVLDPFAGSGTTLAVATGHGRDAVGIDLDQRNADLCQERIGMFLREIIVPLLNVAPPPVEEPEAVLL